MLELPAVQDTATALVDGAHVARRRALRDAARGRRPRQAAARLLPRRGAPALRRREQGVRRLRVADRAAHPLEGRGRDLRDAHVEGRPGRRPRSARQSRPARAARVHAGRREGAARHGAHLPEDRLLRPRGAADPARHRRGGGHDHLRVRCPDSCRAHAHPAASRPHGPCRRRGRRREGIAALREVRHAARQPERAGAARGAARAGGRGSGRDARAGTRQEDRGGDRRRRRRASATSSSPRPAARSSASSCAGSSGC